MAIKRGSKVDASFSMASMSDIVFLLLIFLLISTTLINPNSIRLPLPRSNNQTNVKPTTIVSVTKDLQYYVEDEYVPFSQLEAKLTEVKGDMEKPTLSLQMDRSVAVDEMVKVYNIGTRVGFQIILATMAE
jgi:biopolymer transport protein ExbD